MISIEAISLQESQDLKIEYGFHSTPFGECLIALAKGGICHLAFIQDNDRTRALQILHTAWPEARLQEERVATLKVINAIFAPRDSEQSHRLVLKGTEFQRKVWQALLRIPHGKRVAYEQVAQSLGIPKATRAVASAIARNSIAVLIPCHRVIRKSGALHNYRWGAPIKKALLEWEEKC